MQNHIVARAVATALAAGFAAPAAFAACTVGDANQQAACAAEPFYTGGSSAAVSGIGSGFGADECAVAIITFQTVPANEPAGFYTSGTAQATIPSTPDFRAYFCGTTKGTLASNGINNFTLYYRADGGSIVGAYAPLNNAQINELNLNTAWCIPDGAANTYDCATQANAPTAAVPAGTSVITGTDINNATGDTFTGGVAKHAIPFGISDEEPGVYGNTKGEHWAGGGNEDALSATAGVSPFGSPYPYTFLGADATPDSLQGMTHSLLFQQVFGFVASTNLGITDITSADLAAILSGTTTDWNAIVNATTGAPVAAKGTQIIVCQRDVGSGTRSGADIVFTGSGCNPNGVSSLKLVKKNGVLSQPADNFATPDELACVNTHNNAIGYVSIDNFTKVQPLGTTFNKVQALTLDGRGATAQLAASGGYQYVLEASFNTNSNYTVASGEAPAADQTTFFSTLKSELQNLASAPNTGHVNVIPNVGTNKSNAAIGTGALQASGKKFVTSFKRDVTGKGNTCDFLNIG